MQYKKKSIQKEVTEKQVLSFYGMATRAGKTVSGMDQVSNAVEAGEILMILVAKDASMRTREKIVEISQLHQVPCYLFSNIEELGKFSGKSGRAVCGITDEGFVKKMHSLLTESQNAQQI